GDDTEYTYRLTREFKMIVVKNAIINHRDVQTVVDGISPKIWWKEYYLNRNKYLFIREFSTSLIRKVLSTLRIRYNVFKLILSTRIKKKYKRYRKIRIKLLKKSIYDGKHSIYGKTIDPKKYLDELAKIENY
ncbi:MAG: hypothetical protein SOV21_00735, partial [Methanosphaera sp.]|nr:hypothetical protein [Methanosphaera sp.]